jgi:CubicO group peptidase (beta-lactamase class C family)
MKLTLSLAVGGLVVASVVATSALQPPPSRSSAAYHYAAPPTLADGWMTGTLAQAGIDVKRLEAMTDSIRTHPDFNIHAVLVERDSRLVYEEYFSGKDERWGEPIGIVAFTRETKHDLRSVTKSVISALIGIASNSGAIQSLDTPVLDYFPEYKDLQVAERRKITIRHALMMAAGLDWNEEVPYNDPRNDEIVMIRSADPLHYVLSRPIVAAPGVSWRYNGGMTQVLGTILQRATKQPLADYARARLFSPLGITDFEWLGNLAGVPSAASGLRLRPRDLAKFGSLYLHDGRWKGREILPPAWVAESTRRRLTFPGLSTRGYAYQWWHACYATPSGPIEAPTAVGNGTQRVFLLRAQATVVTVLAGRYNDFSTNPPERLLLDFIIPALPATPRAECPS